MPRICFQSVRMRESSLALVEQCNEIIRDYQGQGLRLTLRQLYYQLVTKNVIANVERSYKNLSGIVTDARLSGRMDWNAIEDRVRRPRSPTEYTGLKELAEAALYSYRLPRWKGQTHYAELWVEKDALAGVLEPLASEFHVTLMVNRGYSSASAMYESAKRFIEACKGEDTEDEEETGEYARPNGNDPDADDYEEVPLVRSPVLFYLGDHDPSGEDMVRDVQGRLHTFGIDVLVEKIALTTAQVQEFNPPPNPAKMSDPRAEKYVRKHGRTSWEVDALPPQELARIVRRSFRSVIDKPAMDAVKKQEETDKEKLRNAVAEITSE